MKKYTFLFLAFFLYSSAFAQHMVFAPSPMTTADENDIQMKKLIRRSYHLQFRVADSVADTTVLRLVSKVNAIENWYCAFFKDDTTRVAVAVKKLSGHQGYLVRKYWKNKYKKSSLKYTIPFQPFGDYTSYYQKGAIKVSGTYKLGKRDGKWELFDEKGNSFMVEYFEAGTLKHLWLKGEKIK